MTWRLQQVNAVSLVTKGQFRHKNTVPDVVPVLVDASQFPEAVARDLIESFKTRRLNHKFLYSSYRQAAKWLKLHEAYSPARNDPDCERVYDEAFRGACEVVDRKHVTVIGLGCGGGQKDARLLQILKQTKVLYVPVDVSMPLVISAAERARAIKGAAVTSGVVCDLGTAADLAKTLQKIVPATSTRLFTFFGMMPNFEPDTILPPIARLIHRGDLFLLSANLAPGKDYRKGVEKVLPQYANHLTNDWLLAFLEDFGIQPTDGKIEWSIQSMLERLLRISAECRFHNKVTLDCEGQTFQFLPGEKMRLFFSYRYTPERLQTVLKRHGLAIKRQWITSSGEEGVFLCRR
jgi:L-histidine N-alpha-methyltransferase